MSTFEPSLIVRATFKLTRDSQAATRSPTALEDFRTRFRDKSDPYLWFLSCVTNISIILDNRAHLRAYMQQALDNMVYYRGDIKLSVQIGTPVLFSLTFF